jgi:hypothetical protein
MIPVGDTNPRVAHRLLGKLVRSRVVGQSARVIEHLAHGHASPCRRHGRNPLPDRVVEPESAVADELQRDGTAERLGDTGDPHVIRRPWWLPAHYVRSAGAQDGQASVSVERRDRARGPALAATSDSRPRCTAPTPRGEAALPATGHASSTTSEAKTGKPRRKLCIARSSPKSPRPLRDPGLRPELFVSGVVLGRVGLAGRGGRVLEELGEGGALDARHVHL